MSVALGITMDEAAAYEFRDGIKPQTKRTSNYFDDGKSITTTFTQFCEGIDSNVPLFEDRQVEGVNRRFTAYSFNLVAGTHIDTDILATIMPITPKDSPAQSYEVNTKSSTEMKLLLVDGEPILLKRNGEPFAIMCPADHYVLKKIANEIAAERAPAQP